MAGLAVRTRTRWSRRAWPRMRFTPSGSSGSGKRSHRDGVRSPGTSWAPGSNACTSRRLLPVLSSAGWTRPPPGLDTGLATQPPEQLPARRSPGAECGAQRRPGVRQGWVRPSESWKAAAPARGLQSPEPAFSSSKDSILDAQGQPRVATSVRPVHPASGGPLPLGSGPGSTAGRPAQLPIPNVPGHD